MTDLFLPPLSFIASLSRLVASLFMMSLLLSSCGDAAYSDEQSDIYDQVLSTRSTDIDWCDADTPDPMVYLFAGSECRIEVNGAPDLCCVHFRFKKDATDLAWTLSTNPYDYESKIGAPNPSQTVQYSGTVVDDCNGKMRVCFEQTGSHFIFQTFDPVTGVPVTCNEYPNQCSDDPLDPTELCENC